MYADIVRSILKMSFLHVLETSEIARTVTLESSRANDPKGVFYISISKRADSKNACTLRISVCDDQFAFDVKNDKIAFRPGIKGTLSQLLIGNVDMIERKDEPSI